jgi:hypothetical protein
MGTREEIIARLRAILEDIVARPERLAAMSAQATRRARTLFAWPAKARQTFEVYRWVLGRRATKPDARMPFPDPDPAPVAAALSAAGTAR